MNRQSNILEEPTGSRPTQLPEVSFGHKLHILETFYHNGAAEGKSESSKSSVRSIQQLWKHPPNAPLMKFMFVVFSDITRGNII